MAEQSLNTGDHPLYRAETAACRWCTDATLIVWCVTAAGKRIPIEADPNPAGNVEVVIATSVAPPLAVVHPGPPGMLDDWTAYMPHHATCARDRIPETPR